MKNVFGTIGNYFVTAFTELQKVVWPTRRDVVIHTLVVALSVILAVVFLGLIDFGLTTLLRKVILR